MTGTFRIATIAALSLVGALQFPRACDAVTSNGGVLYLRAQYKLVTGDVDSAQRLMQRAMEAERHAASANPASDTTKACTRAPYIDFATL